MKLLIYEKFFDSFIQLPRGIQKKVMDFQKKFREDSKSAAIHLEPIISFKDKSLRTARIDQKYRVIIKAPITGETYYLLWVDNHDEAMAWAENKMFQWNENTHSVQVFTFPEESVSTTLQTLDKKEEHFLYDDISDKRLMQIAVPEVLLPSVRKIGNLNDLEKLEIYLPKDAFENLFYLADGANIDTLISEVKEGKTNSDNIEEQISSFNNKRSFIELTDNELFNEVLEGNLKKWKFYLHPSQNKIVNGDFKGPVKITGGAGTGKTVAALHRLKYLSKNILAGKKIVFTTFTKALTKNLKELAQELEIEKSKITINNIDSLVFELANQYSLIEYNQHILGLSTKKKSVELWDEFMDSRLISYDKDFLMNEYENVILYNDVQSLDQYFRTSRVGMVRAVSRRQRKEIWDILDDFSKFKGDNNLFYKEEIYNKVTNYLNAAEIRPFEYCVADELQDISNVELRFLRALIEEKENDLFLVGDPLQTIYSKRINFSKAGINIRGRRSQRLRINYRTTEEIKKLALSVIQDCTYNDFDGEEEEKRGYVSLFHGNEPQYSVFTTKDKELSHILELLQNGIDNGITLSEIAISSRTKDGIKEVKSALHINNIAYYDISDSSHSGNVSGVRLSTFHNLKGLEFKIVILTDVNERTCPLLPWKYNQWDKTTQNEHLKLEKSLIYVAASRAIYNLQITGTGAKSGVIQI